MFEPYDNQADIDEIQRKIDEISPGLKLNYFSLRWNTRHAIEAGVSIPLKGNKALIEKLVSIGFRKGQKRGVYDNSYRYLHGKLTYLIDLHISLPEPPKEAKS